MAQFIVDDVFIVERKGPTKKKICCMRKCVRCLFGQCCAPFCTPNTHLFISAAQSLPIRTYSLSLPNKNAFRAIHSFQPSKQKQSLDFFAHGISIESQRIFAKFPNKKSLRNGIIFIWRSKVPGKGLGAMRHFVLDQGGNWSPSKTKRKGQKVGTRHSLS